MRLAVLGDPLAYTLSPALHRAALAAAGLAGDSEALRTTPAALGERLASLARAGYRGVNLTHPLKAHALAHLARVAPGAERARSVNTVTFEPAGWEGESTDGPGFLDFLSAIGRADATARTVVLGAGGAARALAVALEPHGAVTMIARDPARAEGPAGAACVAWGSDAARAALESASLVVNATPLDDPADPAATAAEALVCDLRYGPELSAWAARARAAGREAHDGLGLLVFQARRSLARWLGADVALAPLAAAVGWPR